MKEQLNPTEQQAVDRWIDTLWNGEVRLTKAYLINE